MNPKNDTPTSPMESWVPKIITSLRTGWADYLLNLPANQPVPNFSDWLALIHTAVITPDKLPQFLDLLLDLPPGATPPPGDWVLLSDLLSVTFEAAKAESARLDTGDWQNIFEIQNRILKTAARISGNLKAHPGTGKLSQRALYLQTVAAIDKLFESDANLDHALDKVVKLLHQNFGYEYINLFLLSPAKNELVLAHAWWGTALQTPAERLRLKPDEGIVGQVIITGQTILEENVFVNPHFMAHPALPHIKSQVAVPLLVYPELLGVLDVESTQLAGFSADDQKILEAVGQHLALAIENRRLRQIHQRYTQEQGLIYDTIITLGKNSDLERGLKIVSQKITQVMEAGACVICKVDRTKNTVTAMTEYVLRHPGNPPSTWRPLNLPIPVSKDPISHKTLAVARPTISRDKTGAKNSAWRFSRDKKTNLHWNVVLSIPFEIKSKVTGLLEVYDKNPNRQFSPEDVQLCRILATQTAIAIEQNNLFNETLHRLSEVSLLYTMAQKIATSLDLPEVLNTIVTSLKDMAGCRACCIFLLDDSEKMLEIKAAVGLKPHWREMAKLAIGEGAAGRAAATGRSLYVPDTTKDPEYVVFDQEVKSLMVVPLFAHGKVIGTINVDDTRVDAFGPDQERMLTIAATQAGISIENARLFTRIFSEQRQWEAVINNMADGLLLIDKDGVIITCTPILAHMLDLHRGQIIGKNVRSATLPLNLAKVSGASPNKKTRTGVLGLDVTLEGSKPRKLQVFVTTLFDHQGLPAGEVRVVHDITKEKDLEQMKDDFFSTISHELRTPLFSIQGFAQLMLEEPALDSATQKEFLTTIQRQAAQLSEMVNNLLDLSKLDDNKLDIAEKMVSIVDIVHQTILKLQGYAHQQQVSLVTNMPMSLPSVIGDSYRLEQVMTNLIGNAIKFSPPGETVTISAKANSHAVLIQVRDNGIGIPSAELENIWRRYYQAQNNGERSAMGTGLGLHIAKQIIEKHRGKIWAESDGQHGSTFSFTLPRAL